MSSMGKELVSEAVDSDHEESSWTYYFQDFLCNHNNIDHEDTTSSFSSAINVKQNPSLVSDAASKVVGFSSLGTSCKKLSFKKRKNKGLLVDDALEDTASSPVNSPKVCGLYQLDMNWKERSDDDTTISRGKHCSDSGKTDERSELDIAGRDNTHDCTELKKKGLCLVPVSMFSNYLD